MSDERGPIGRLVVGTALVLAAACGGDDVDVASRDSPRTATTATTATTSTSAVPVRDGPPAILVTAGSTISRVDGAEVETVGEVDGDAFIAFGDGVSDVQAVQVDGTLVAMRSGTPTQLDPGAPGTVALFDVVSIDGVPHALYGVHEERGERSGVLLLGSITGDTRRDLGTASAPEYTVLAGSIGGGLLATSAYADLTESVDIRPLDGDGEPNPWSPTTDLEYNAPPLVLAAMLAPDGATVAWLSGPDHDGRTGEDDVGSWEVVVASIDGEELHRLPLDRSPEPVHLDFDGRRVLVSREGAPALLIDLANGTRTELPVDGIATFDG